jgi:2-methylisocitrate lyase-like PEP mutase family enzyme
MADASQPSAASSVATGSDMAARFRELHGPAAATGPGGLLVLPNPYDIGSARLLEHLGFRAVATTSAGLARSLGRPDAARAVSRREAIDHAATIAAAVRIPVSGDLEDGFTLDPDGVAGTIGAARRAGLAGCCIEDATYDRSAPIIGLGLAVERVAAAAEAAHAGGHPFVLTARTENILYGWRDLDETVTRLNAYAAVGADVVYAPGLVALDDIRRVVESVDKPVNVLVGLPGQDWSLADLREVGVRRVSVGSALSRAAFSAVIDVAGELLAGGRVEPRGGAGPDLDAVFSRRP